MPAEQTVAAASSLSRRAKWTLLAVVVVQFLIGAGPVWRRPFDWDASILWSYASIPVLVAAVLAWQRKLRWKGWLLDTVEITAVKFAITATFLVVWLVSWQVRGGQRPPPPPPGPVATEPRPPRPPDTRPAPPAEAPATLEGTAAPGALVFVSKGLEAYAFARSGEPADLAHDREGFVPRALGVQVGQELRLRSADGRLHTLLAKKVGGGWVRNVPITGGGETRVTFDEPVGAVTLECKVHGASEAPGMMAILDHPSWTVADASGRFSLRVALSGEGEVTAASPGSAPVTRPYRVGAGQRVEVTLK